MTGSNPTAQVHTPAKATLARKSLQECETKESSSFPSMQNLTELANLQLVKDTASLFQSREALAKDASAGNMEASWKCSVIACNSDIEKGEKAVSNWFMSYKNNTPVISHSLMYFGHICRDYVDNRK